MLVEPWPSIRDSVAVNESRVFAQGLEGLGERWQCEPLVHYAQKLAHDAENYAVTDLEKHLGEFAALVEQLDAPNMNGRFQQRRAGPGPNPGRGRPARQSPNRRRGARQLGCEIIPAADGATALKRVALRPPDLILLDLLMPGMGGCEVCKKLKENSDWRDIPVIFLSAADDKDLIVRALDAGGVDYITKPFNQAELISRVRTQLALKMARDQLKQLAEDKDELLGVLAHDLKNYLGGMNMSAGLLRDQAARFHDERLTQLAENIFCAPARSRWPS